MPLLEIRHLTVEFVSSGHVLRAVEDVSLSVEAGEAVCLVGESGSGKSVTALTIARLLSTPPARYPQGEILLEGRDVLKQSNRELRRIRGGVVSYVFQEPAMALNPVMRVGDQIREVLKLHRPASANQSEVVRLLTLAGIAAPELRAKEYPFRMSGGMQQRVMLAMALAAEPKLLVADEPTTALDVTIQAQILELLRELKQRLRMALLLITHNLAIVAGIGDRVAVMYAAQIVETGPASEVLREPLHPYTRALLNSVPQINHPQERLASIPGQVPRPGQFPTGCRFYPRCPSRRPECAERMPSLVEKRKGRFVRCDYV